MFGKIFSKELKQQFRSFTIVILIVSAFLFYYTQFIGDLKQWWIKPIPLRTDTEVILEKREKGFAIDNKDVEKAVYESMKADYESGYTLRIRGISRIYEKINNSQKQVLKEAIDEIENKSLSISYDEFEKIMKSVDNALGGNTSYSEKYYLSIFAVQSPYESEMKRYNKILKEDRVTNAYARLFADYMGVGVGFFVVFITAFTFIKDRRYSVNEFIYTSQVSSFEYVGGKYLADVLISFFIVLLAAGHATFMFYEFSKLNGDPISYGAFFKYTALWILPTIMFVSSLSYVSQLIFDNGIIPIIIQFILWIYSINMDNKFNKYIIRFNRIVPYSEFKTFENSIFINRIFFTLLSILLFFIAVKLWDKKRVDNFSR